MITIKIKSHKDKRYQTQIKILNQKLYQQLCQLNKPSIIHKHQKQIQATLKTIAWYDADIGLDHLLFQAYSLVHHNDDYEFQRLKLLAKTYLQNQAKAEISPNYTYYLIQEPIILEFLWQNPQIRSLVISWLIGFIKLKNKYGFEIESHVRITYHFLNPYIQLLTGITNQTHIYLKSYKRYPKKTLTKNAWQQQIYQNRTILATCWD